MEQNLFSVIRYAPSVSFFLFQDLKQRRNKNQGAVESKMTEIMLHLMRVIQCSWETKQWNGANVETLKDCLSDLPVAALKPVKWLGLLAVLGNMSIVTSLFSTSSSSLRSTWYRQLHLSFSEIYAPVSLVQSAAAVWFRGSLGIT